MGGLAPGCDRRDGHARSIQDRRDELQSGDRRARQGPDGSRDRCPRRADGPRRSTTRASSSACSTAARARPYGGRGPGRQVQVRARSPATALRLRRTSTLFKAKSRTDRCRRRRRCESTGSSLRDGATPAMPRCHRYHRDVSPRPDAHRRAEDRRRPGRRSIGARAFGVPDATGPGTRPAQDRHATAVEASDDRLLRASKPQPGDDEPAPFSFLNEYDTSNWRPPLTQVHCHLTQHQ